LGRNPHFKLRRYRPLLLGFIRGLAPPHEDFEQIRHRIRAEFLDAEVFEAPTAMAMAVATCDFPTPGEPMSESLGERAMSGTRA
jgi:hypothetical protein